MHGVLAWAACVLVGRWVWPHVSLMWTRRGGRGQAWWLGLVTLLVGLLMAGTGLGLLYGPADWREDSLALHWWMGLGWPLLCLVHGLRQRI
jgi:hypothetical protein